MVAVTEFQEVALERAKECNIAISANDDICIYVGLGCCKHHRLVYVFEDFDEINSLIGRLQALIEHKQSGQRLRDFKVQ